MKKIIIITGPSGAGKTFALHNLEDLGYTCIDGVPYQLLSQLYAYIDPNDKKVAISLDIRNLPDNKQDINSLLKRIQKKVEIEIIYIDAQQSEIIRRFSETRRLHPLSQYNHSLSQALEIEEKLLEQLKNMASLIIDTTTLSIHNLNERLKIYIHGSSESKLLLIIQSFGFKHGHPEDADYIFDVRFLPNPYWEENLRQFGGKDQPIIDYFNSFKLVQQTINQIENLFQIWLPMLEQNNRSYVTIAIGCTGGKHRSVYVAEKLAALFTNQYQVELDHKCLILK
jgi:UPF0042 nucleotide-binding protein